MGWLTSVFNFFTNPVADLVGGYTERKKIAAETAADEAKAKSALKIAKLNAQARKVELDAERTAATEENDSSYDNQVLANRRDSYADEFIIAVFLGIFIAHFIPALQPYMHAGWVAMGYTGIPWWYEFVIVGICVSTLGLMRLFRIFWGVRAEAKGRG
ncbi:hypothetical protein [Shewanella dokdonensis]|uniref:Uncharacterized protein n=1 Tax=Shewanella dokdonensis TaxID=712036 RepID=A0ABX8DGR6_9GAMM|nr:hypothetical protein [Shewanella dokdonensis]MCL1072989.1 hypothetical protein [Shewanella dokdonensis]QVK23097.1 hypothetical protein KHX94_18695 [Shewanella dokdonensis]